MASLFLADVRNKSKWQGVVAVAASNCDSEGDQVTDALVARTVSTGAGMQTAGRRSPAERPDGVWATKWARVPLPVAQSDA